MADGEGCSSGTAADDYNTATPSEGVTDATPNRTKNRGGEQQKQGGR